VSVAACAALAAAPASAQTLEAARSLYEQAAAEPDPAKRLPLLESSLGELETYEARLALGEALMELSRHQPAREQFQRAITIAANDGARARATYMVAESFLGEGDEAAGLPLLQRAASLHPYPPILDRLKAIERKSLGHTVSAAEITRTLTNQSTRAFGVKPAVNLRIGFAFDEASLAGDGRRQADELGRALAAMKDVEFEIIGHTDKQGDADYNLQLSRRRADAVKRYLVATFGISEAALSASGMGESHLLYPGDDEEDHSLNRRVEVVVK